MKSWKLRSNQLFDSPCLRDFVLDRCWRRNNLKWQLGHSIQLRDRRILSICWCCEGVENDSVHQSDAWHSWHPCLWNGLTRSIGSKHQQRLNRMKNLVAKLEKDDQQCRRSVGRRHKWSHWVIRYCHARRTNACDLLCRLDTNSCSS